MTSITVKEVTQEYGVHISTIYRWEDQGVIPKSRKWGSLKKWYTEENQAHKRGELKPQSYPPHLTCDGQTLEVCRK